jgi:hypothetical protein
LVNLVTLFHMSTSTTTIDWGERPSYGMHHIYWSVEESSKTYLHLSLSLQTQPMSLCTGLSTRGQCIRDLITSRSPSISSNLQVAIRPNQHTLPYFMTLWWLQAHM